MMHGRPECGRALRQSPLPSNMTSCMKDGRTGSDKSSREQGRFCESLFEKYSPAEAPDPAMSLSVLSQS